MRPTKTTTAALAALATALLWCQVVLAEPTYPPLQVAPQGDEGFGTANSLSSSSGSSSSSIADDADPNDAGVASAQPGSGAALEAGVIQLKAPESSSTASESIPVLGPTVPGSALGEPDDAIPVFHRPRTDHVDATDLDPNEWTPSDANLDPETFDGTSSQPNGTGSAATDAAHSSASASRPDDYEAQAAGEFGGSSGSARGPMSACDAGEVEMSVEQVVGIFCVSATHPCSGNIRTGDCPGPQPGLDFGAFCTKLKTGAYGCHPHRPPSLRATTSRRRR